MMRKLQELCEENRYVTTLHLINSAILKLSKIQRADRVFRGISGGAVLPKEFWNANDQNVKGGVEFAFMSTTLDRKVAMDYASNGKNAMVLEMQMGMIDRGADMSWLSQCMLRENQT
jgi:NLR family CARD domain-containing protein 3